jgi:molybdate transport system substrate-binding protein
MIKVFTKTFSLFIIAWSISATISFAQTVRLAIAANLQPVMKDLKKDFKVRTGIDIEVVSGSSGNLAAQIRNSAPYDLFLSADKDFPEALYKDGFTIQGPAVYARGVLIICSTQNLSFNTWPKLLQSGNINKIAIGNPDIAPYGKAAREALTKAGVYDRLKAKIVFGESISQVNTYITTGVVQAGFTTLSLIKDAGNKVPLFYKTIDPKAYAPIEQAMVLLKYAKGNAAASKFYQYILSSPAKRIFKAYGYTTL